MEFVYYCIQYKTGWIKLYYIPVGEDGFIREPERRELKELQFLSFPNWEEFDRFRLFLNTLSLWETTDIPQSFLRAFDDGSS